MDRETVRSELLRHYERETVDVATWEVVVIVLATVLAAGFGLLAWRDRRSE